jgi:uncharacterized Zn finger protein (UPF0148 family)
MTPILCRSCGGPVTPIDDVHIVCPFCATKDELPREAHARVRELRRRLAARARTIHQLSRVDLALALAFERPVTLLKVMAPMAAFPLLMLAKLPTSLASVHPPSVGEVLGDLYLALGLPLALALALLYARRRYFREVCEDLQARRPVGSSGRAGCRCCGASLVAEYGPLIRCRHCHTYSLVTPEQQRRGAVALEAEEAAHRQQRSALARHVSTTSPGIDRTFVLAFALIFFCGWMVLDAIVVVFAG